MITFRACPRCRGDLYREQDQYGAFDSCIQCGAAIDTVEDRVAVAPLDAAFDRVTATVRTAISVV